MLAEAGESLLGMSEPLLDVLLRKALTASPGGDQLRGTALQHGLKPVELPVKSVCRPLLARQGVKLQAALRPGAKNAHSESFAHMEDLAVA